MLRLLLLNPKLFYITMKTETTRSPLMQTFDEAKRLAPKGALIAMQCGHFYEFFEDQAHTAADVLNITLTHRKGIPMSGIPCHSAEDYFKILVEAGHTVVIAEQKPRKNCSFHGRVISRVMEPVSSGKDAITVKLNHSFRNMPKDTTLKVTGFSRCGDRSLLGYYDVHFEGGDTIEQMLPVSDFTVTKGDLVEALRDAV